MKKIIALILSASMLFSISFVTAYADDMPPEEQENEIVSGVPVAETGGVNYTTLDEAISAATDGGTVTLLGDCSTKGFTLDKAIVINGGEASKSITFTTEGFTVNGKDLTFKNCSVTMDKIGLSSTSPFCNILLSSGANLSLDTAELCMTGDKDGVGIHAIYFTGGSGMNILSSKLTITDFEADALEWDGGASPYNITIEDSEVILDNNRSGFTGTFDIDVTDSKLEVTNSSGNGSNGSNFEITDSEINFSGNHSHGLSANKLHITDSNVKTNDNGFCGIAARDITIDKDSSVTVTGNNYGNLGGGAFRLLGSSAKCEISAGADVKITDNFLSGIKIDGSQSEMNMLSGTVTGNGRNEECLNGGGVNTVGKFTMGTGVKIYNNHASVSGDDIFCSESGKLLIKKTSDMGKNLVLDDCGHYISGWYHDGIFSENNISYQTRWNAEGCNGQGEDFIHEFLPSEDVFCGVLAVKAAHETDPQSPEPPSLVIPSSPIPVIEENPDTGYKATFSAVPALILLCAAVFAAKKKN